MRSLLKKVQKRVTTDEQTREWEKKVEGEKPEEDEEFIKNKALPRSRRRRAVSDKVLVLTLPNLRDATPATRGRLLIRKLRLCSYVFEFNDTPDTPLEAKRKEVKRAALLELVNYLTVFKPAFTDEELNEVFEMLACNLFRPLPPSTLDLMGMYNPEEDEPQSEPTWPHLQVVYEFLLRLASSKETDSKLLDKYLSREFVLNLLQLFDSEDPRERDYLKTILHRIYGNFMGLRPFIRRAINNVFYEYIYKTDGHNGIAELLEILGSIINGFALPLKEQHKVFLSRVLLPLHKVTYIGVFHPQLSYCVTQFLEKDATLAPKIVTALLKYWPVTCSKKELMFLNEMEEILDRVQPHHLGQTQVPLFRQVAKSINSPHFQVSERAIYVLNNDVILRFITNNRETLVPILSRALYANTHLHRKPGERDVKITKKAAPPGPIGKEGIKTTPPSPTGTDDTKSSPAPGTSEMPKSPGKSGGSEMPGSPRRTLGVGGEREISSPTKSTIVLDRKTPAVALPGQKWEELGHWNDSIVELTADILKLFTEMDPSLMSRCSKQYDANIVQRASTVLKRSHSWAVLSDGKASSYASLTISTPSTTPSTSITTTPLTTTTSTSTTSTTLSSSTTSDKEAPKEGTT